VAKAAVDFAALMEWLEAVLLQNRHTAGFSAACECGENFTDFLFPFSVRSFTHDSVAGVNRDSGELSCYRWFQNGTSDCLWSAITDTEQRIPDTMHRISTPHYEWNF
jgi:hypothetical protein